MVQMYYSSLFVILHAMSVTTFSLTENEMEEMDKLQQNNLAKTMETVNETTLAAEKVNITKLIKSAPSWIAFMTDLDNSKDLAANIRNLEILCMNVSIPTDTEEFNTNAISENIHPSMNESEVFESTHLSMNESEVSEISTTSIRTFETEVVNDNQNILEAIMEGFSANPVSGNTHPSISASEASKFEAPDNTHPSMNASEILENNIPSISAIDAKAFMNNITIEEITTTLSEKTTLEQLESMSFSTLEQTKSTSSSTLVQKESTPSSTVNINVQLSNRTRSRAISGVIYEKTDGVPTKCQSNADCYDLHEPEAWCDLKSDEFWFGQGCYCNEILQSCIIQVWKNDQLYYTDCRRRDQHHCSSNS